MALHKNLDTSDGIHIPYAWTFASASARQSASGLVGSDVGKFARQTDDNSLWMLLSVTPTWAQVSAGSGEVPTQLLLIARKGSGGTITKGSPVYISGYDGGGGHVHVEEAQADSASTMPCVGLANSSITDSADSTVVVFGQLGDVDTSSYSSNDALFVSAASAGTLTGTRPTGASDKIQKVGVVVYSHDSNGIVMIIGAGRINAMPQLTEGMAWEGNSSNQPAEVVPFGAWKQDAASETQSSTSSETFIQKLRLTTPSIPAGRYRIGWNYEWQYNNAANDALVQVELDDTTILMEMSQEPADSGSDQWNNKSGFGYVDLTATTHFIDMDYRSGNDLYSIKIRRARLEFWRVS